MGQYWSFLGSNSHSFLGVWGNNGYRGYPRTLNHRSRWPERCLRYRLRETRIGSYYMGRLDRLVSQSSHRPIASRVALHQHIPNVYGINKDTEFCHRHPEIDNNRQCGYIVNIGIWPVCDGRLPGRASEYCIAQCVPWFV